MARGTIGKKMRRVALALAAGALFTALGAGSAIAFEPPADPADVFTGGGAAGHPGVMGQIVATGLGTGGAWNAHANSDMIDN